MAILLGVKKRPHTKSRGWRRRRFEHKREDGLKSTVLSIFEFFFGGKKFEKNLPDNERQSL